MSAHFFQPHEKVQHTYYSIYGNIETINTCNICFGQENPGLLSTEAQLMQIDIQPICPGHMLKYV